MNNTKYKWFKGDPTEFKSYDGVIAGEDVVLIIPNDKKAVGSPWNDADKIYRSSIWTAKDGKPVSLGYKKFVNYGEMPDFEPVNVNDTITAIEKVDGTCLICSKFKDEYIFRTRGTFDAITSMPNGYELNELIEKYNIKEILDKNSDCTIIFEWVSPANLLCVKYAVPELYLTGIVKHSSYTYKRQEELDLFAQEHGLKRPKHYTFKNGATADHLSAEIKEWTQVEGVVAYFGTEQQVLKKMKSNWHHHLHIARVMLANKKKLLGYLYDIGAFDNTSETEYEDIITKNLEYEVIDYYRNEFRMIYLAYTQFVESSLKAKEFVKDVTDPYEIVDKLRNGEYGDIAEQFIWGAYRNLPIKKSFIVNFIVNIIEK